MTFPVIDNQDLYDIADKICWGGTLTKKEFDNLFSHKGMHLISEVNRLSFLAIIGVYNNEKVILIIDEENPAFHYCYFKNKQMLIEDKTLLEVIQIVCEIDFQ